MQENIRTERKPKITIGESDFAKLTALAEAFTQRAPAVAEELYAELDRAKVVPDRAVPANVVRMGSLVEFQPAGGEAKTVTLVYPADADIAEGKVSIMTPIGTALLGLAPGQAINWTARDGKRHELSIIDVRQPGEAPLAAAGS